MITKKVIELSKDRSLILKYNSLEDEDEIDTDKIVKIDFNNIPAELVTIPVLLSQFSTFLADMNEKVNIAKLNVDVLEAELSAKFREAHKEETGKDLSNEKTSEKVMTDPKYKITKRIHFKAIKDKEILEGIYWSIKSKDQKLTQLSNSVNLGDAVETLLNNKLKRFNYVDLKLANTNNSF